MNTFFKTDDVEALAVLIRYIDTCGESVLGVVPVNDFFVVKCSGRVEVTSETNLKPFAVGFNSKRIWWPAIVTIDESATTYLELFQ